MLPLKDNIPSRTTPIVNYTLIGLCLLAFMVQVSDPDGGITLKWGFIPGRVSKPDVPIVIEHHELVQTPFGLREETARTEVPAPPIPALMTALTCVFLHGSVMHLLGNMWFLYIFGDNVEDRLGHVGYLIFYLACGIAASLTHYQKNKERMRAQIYESIKEQRKTKAYKQKMKEKHLDALLARALVRFDAV